MVAFCKMMVVRRYLITINVTKNLLFHAEITDRHLNCYVKRQSWGGHFPIEKTRFFDFPKIHIRLGKVKKFQFIRIKIEVVIMIFGSEWGSLS